MSLDDSAIRELEFWASSLSSFNGRSAVPLLSSVTLHTDASDIGWGAWVAGERIAFGAFSPELLATDPSSTRRELAAILCAFRSPTIRSALAGQRILILVDSSAAVANLHNGGGPVPELSQLVKSIWSECVSIGADASAERVSRSLNQRADQLSRRLDDADWSLDQKSADLVIGKFGQPSLDRFATVYRCLSAI
jgi:hypothetical protein